MHIGTQLQAPDGFHSLSKSIRYYFAGRRSHDRAALLVWFEKARKQRRVRCIWLGECEFERALLDDPPGLVHEKRQYTLPEWLKDQEGVSFEEIEELRYKNKKETYRQQVERAYTHISEAVANAEKILSSDNPLKALSSYNAKNGKGVHLHRMQVWFFSFILHGRNIWALKRSGGLTGRWDRADASHTNRKLGRPSLSDGSMYGWPSGPMQEKIRTSYLRFCGLGVTMADIHRKALADVFGTKVRKLESGRLQLYHPENEPFPSYGQFRYRVVRKFGVDDIRNTVWGYPRVRLNAKQNKGNFTRPYANLLESVAVDAFHVAERPRAFRSDAPMSPLIVARGICETSGAVVGVGFSLGAETAEAYRSMLFCMAIPKKYYARLIGVPPDDLDWIAEGLPPSFMSDRGPGGTKDLVTELELAFPIKTIIPSYSGQSNAVAEASHPRTINLEGAPSFLQSDLDVAETIKREVYRACRDNHTSDISSRLSNEAVHVFLQRGWPATPHCYWKYLEERLRTSGHAISVEQAVRAFCTPVSLKVDCHGVNYKGTWYNSDEFKATRIQTQVAGLADVTLSGFILSMMVRYLWVEVRGRLIEVEALRRVREDGEDLYIPLSRLNEFAEERRGLRAMTRESTTAADVDTRLRFEAETGHPWDAAHRRAGSPKRPSGTTAEEADVLGRTASRRRG
ncbi:MULTISPECIES: hypothetical protein [Paraburkholderia]|uniref:hypothetical protein n=1 Tax=Paraburkholderia TaxID=1822464 RepID=UPI002258A19D|nr:MULTISPECIES: hypothetical protein [Paraburkholderia]MCX4162773.1 hypothetical protein [Paraburkholderia megapolitana]MDN7158268.1 hypothetical protein [Paraburkholderia sp. CHISQ3]MDQ6495315.1 hypothetical protein [Paraburkholderia megapolitana]